MSAPIQEPTGKAGEAPSAKPPSAGFWRKVGVVLSGTAVAQAIPILGSLVIARLVAPAEFGVFAAWLGLAALAAVVITGRYENALAIEHDGAPRRVAALAILGLAVAVALLLGVALLLAWWLLPAVRARLPVEMVWLLPPAAWVIAAAQTWQSWAAAEGRYAALSSMRIAQSIAVTGGQIALGLLAPGAVSLALAHAAGVALGLVVAAWHLSPRPWPAGFVARAFFVRHRRFPQWSLPADSINTAAGQLPVILVATRFGAEAAGLLALTLRTLGAPIALLGSAVLDVFKRRAAQAYRERGQCQAEYLETLRVLALASVVVTLVIGLAGESIFAWAFGETWRRAGTMAVWLLPMFALRFVASPLSYTFYIAGKQPVDLAWQCALLVMTLASLLLPAQPEAALKFYSLGYSALYLVYLALSYRFSLGVRPS